MAFLPVPECVTSFQVTVSLTRYWTEYPVIGGSLLLGASQATFTDVALLAVTVGLSGVSGGFGIVMVAEMGSDMPSEFLYRILMV